MRSHRAPASRLPSKVKRYAPRPATIGLDADVPDAVVCLCVAYQFTCNQSTKVSVFKLTVVPSYEVLSIFDPGAQMSTTSP